MLTIFLIAGEPSGDALGARLMQAFYRKEGKGAVRFLGVGGSKMEAEGLRSLFPMAELSVMGFLEVLPHIPQVLQRINQVVSEIIRVKPDVVVTIDAPGFNFRVAKKLNEHGLRELGRLNLIHYVAPTVWAYRPERALKTALLFDHLLVLFPFEPKYFDAVGLGNSYIGHPLVEEAPVTEKEKLLFREKYHIPPAAPLLCVLAGSRQGEVKRLLPIYVQAIEKIAKEVKDLHVVWPTLPSFSEVITQRMQGSAIPSIVVSEEGIKKQAMAVSNVALAKSGTVSLELAIVGTPMVTTYRVHPVTAWMMKRLMRIPYVNLVNLIQGQPVVPEFLQEKCHPDTLAEAIITLFKDETARQRQCMHAKEVREKLGMLQPTQPSEKAVDAILAVLNKKRSRSMGQEHV